MSIVTDWANLPYPHPRQLPNSDDIQHHKAIIEQMDRNIEDIEQSIRRLQTQLEEVRTQRANHVSYISPLRRLPTEVLSQIILMCIKDGKDVIEIAAICGRLREVAIGMSTLWSDISLRPIGYEFEGDSFKQYGSSKEVSYISDHMELC
jgi:hypothetical protein